MTRDPHAAAPILVASDNVGDASLVRKLLEPEFDAVEICTDADRQVEEFDRRPADVLILAFDALEKAERHYLGLYRQSRSIHAHPHRTVILCSKDEVRRAYEVCRKQLFDDYILFWPMTHDSPRLPMSVHLALRELAALKDTGPSAMEFAAQARQLAALEGVLQQQLARGDERLQHAGRVARQAEEKAGAALDGFSQRLARGDLADLLEVKNAEGLRREIGRIQHDEIHQPLRAIGQAMEPLAQWTGELRREFEPHLQSSRQLAALADQVRPLVLVVDDDDTQRKLIGAVFKGEEYRLAFATGGLDALALLRKLRPDLILMDVMMPELDGMETTRRLKSMPHLAGVPVIMITGKSEGNVVMDSLKAGASGFIVKPIDKASLLGKAARALRGKSAG